MAIQNDLLHVQDNKVIPSSYALTIREFKNLNIEELAYIYFMIDHRSPLQFMIGIKEKLK